MMSLTTEQLRVRIMYSAPTFPKRTDSNSPWFTVTGIRVLGSTLTMNCSHCYHQLFQGFEGDVGRLLLVP